MGDHIQRGRGGPDPGEGEGGGRRHGYGGGGGGFGGGMGRGGMGPGGGFGGGRSTDEQRQEMERRRALVQELLQPSDRMTVTLEGDMVSFTESDGRMRKFKTDGKKEKHQFDNGTVETKTRWDKDGLVIETDIQNGMKLTQTYGLAPGGEKRQLLVQTKMDGGSRDDDDRKPITHYYDDALDVQ